ncbi:ribosomal protein L16, partial [Microthyrium microscopicum]
MPPPRISNGLLAQLRSLALSPSTHTRPACIKPTQTILSVRSFSTTRPSQNWLLPRRRSSRKTQKGSPQVNTGGSSRGTTIAHGDYGIRLASHDQRIPAKQLGLAVEVIRRRLRGVVFRFYPRVAANLAVYTSGNEQRMGKGKGGFDYWAARVSHGRVVFEIGGDIHEQVVKEALRLAGNKLPGQWEFVKKGEAPVVGTTRLRTGVTKEELFRPRRLTPLHPLHLLPDGRRAGELQAEQENVVVEDVDAVAELPSVAAAA